MRYYALAADYDGTLAHDGQVDAATQDALERLRAAGRKLILVTGRQLDDLRQAFDRLDLFDRVVAENGALLFTPATHEERPLSKPLPAEFAQTLRDRGVSSVAEGRVIVATWTPHEVTVLETIRDLHVDAQVIFNKGAVMVLPTGINKATGLQTALADLGLSPHNVVGVGDAENDQPFLDLCECAAAVANALPEVAAKADFPARHKHGAGVVELIEQLIADDLRSLEPRLARHELVLGNRPDGQDVRVRPYGPNVLTCGSMGGGKSTFATAFMERLGERGYQFCMLDPEGDYENFEHATVFGSSKRAPVLDEVFALLAKPGQSTAVDLLAVAVEHRPGFFEQFLPAFQELRARSGRPHWLLIDEIHHLLPADWGASRQLSPEKVQGMMLITAYPERTSKAVLEQVSLVVATGQDPMDAIVKLSATLGQEPPQSPGAMPEDGAALAWQRDPPQPPFWFLPRAPQMVRRRHRRKYIEGELDPDVSFYFRGPQGQLNLRAQNLRLFLQIAEGIGDDAWLYHLHRHDYSRWFREILKDDDLAAATESIEHQPQVSADESRKAIRQAIERIYAA